MFAYSSPVFKKAALFFTQEYNFSLLSQRPSTPASAGPVEFLCTWWQEAQLVLNKVFPSWAVTVFVTKRPNKKTAVNKQFLTMRLVLRLKDVIYTNEFYRWKNILNCAQKYCRNLTISNSKRLFFVQNNIEFQVFVGFFMQFWPMFKRLKEKWKLSWTSFVLVFSTFAIGGSSCGYLGRKLLTLTGIESGILYYALYIVLMCLLWPLCVIIISIPMGQFGFFRNYLRKMSQTIFKNIIIWFLCHNAYLGDFISIVIDLIILSMKSIEMEC